MEALRVQKLTLSYEILLPRDEESVAISEENHECVKVPPAKLYFEFIEQCSCGKNLKSRKDLEIIA